MYVYVVMCRINISTGKPTFRSTEAVPTSMATHGTLPITLALAPLPTIDPSLQATLAVVTLGVVLTRLLAHPRGGADGVTITLAEGARGEVPLFL